MQNDLLILGAGPAGTATAIAALQKGARVTLVEQQPFPRERPGESLHPGVEPLLRQLGVDLSSQNFERYSGHDITWGSRREFVGFGAANGETWQGFQAWRAEFDSLLLERARILGAHIVQPCRAIQPRMESGRVVGLETTEGEIGGRFVVDAAGGRHWLARHLGLDVLRYSPRLFVRYGYCTGPEAVCDRAPVLDGDERGWVWLSRVKPSLYHWCCLDTSSEREKDTGLPAAFRHLQPIGRVRRRDVTWRIVSAVAGPGYFLAGDAASVLDPLSSHGVLKSLMSGMMIVHLLAQVQLGMRTEAQVGLEYAQWLLEMFQHDVANLTHLYREVDPLFLTSVPS